MARYIGEIFQKVFHEEEKNLVRWLKRRKFAVLIILALLIGVMSYRKWPTDFVGLFHLLASRIDIVLLFFLVTWLAILTFFLLWKARESNTRRFKEDFRHGLTKWEYYGEWKTEKEDDQYILIVTDSDAGGLAKPCRLWDDYIFEFETKIAQSNSSWIIRASDILNYVMLQCSQKEIRPHFRMKGLWFTQDPVALPVTLPINEWFKVQIKVSGTRVVVTVVLDYKETVLLDRDLLKPEVMQVQATTVGTTSGSYSLSVDLAFSFPLGSVGFRECGKTECAHFRAVRVKKL
ncbi:DUF1080 domain-containing protein [Acidobacteria bacterium AH-259-G07]|nr:DUF1080 domain-containing protein [Acidobacteria bacterium AH-259-G07]